MSGKLPPIPADLLARARDADLLTTAQPFLARLKRVTAAELAGACPACGGTDRFSVNTKKRAWNCRGFGGGADALSFVMHVYGLDFRGAVEHLTGKSTAPEPVQPGPSAPKPQDLDEKEREARVKRSVARIVLELVPIRGTPGERYLREVGKIDVDTIADVLERTDAIGRHPSVYFNAPGDAERGEPAVRAPGEATVKAKRSEDVEKVKQALVEAYRRLCHAAAHVRGFDGKVETTRLRDAVKSRGFLETDDDGKITATGRQHWQRAKTDLIASRIFMEEDGKFWQLTAAVLV